MKYAFIVMIVIYLITYGCNSDHSKTETKPPKKVEKITVEQTQPTVPAPAQEQPAQPAGAETPAVQPEHAAAPTAPAAEQPVVVPPENVAGVTEPQPAPEPPMPCNMQQQPIPEDRGMLFANPENLVIMPCGRVFVREEVPGDMPCMGMPQQEGPMAQEEPAMPQMMPEQSQPQASPETRQEELAAAMQKMVQATNEMVMVTRQMVIATEEMLKATQGAAGEEMDTDKGLPDRDKQQPEQQQPGAAAEPGLQPQAQVPAPARSPEEGVVESMKDVVAAAKEVIEVTNHAISKTVEHQHQ